MKLSSAQQKIIERMKAGESLKFDHRTGRYIMKKSDVEKDIDQRPVLVMLRDGALAQDLTGECRVVG